MQNTETALHQAELADGMRDCLAKLVLLAEAARRDAQRRSNRSRGLEHAIAEIKLGAAHRLIASLSVPCVLLGVDGLSGDTTPRVATPPFDQTLAIALDPDAIEEFCAQERADQDYDEKQQSDFSGDLGFFGAAR